MVLRILVLILFLTSSWVFSQELDLIDSDFYSSNYYTTNNTSYQNKLFVGNDMFRFLDEENLDIAVDTLFNFLSKNQLFKKRNYKKINNYTIAIPIDTKNIELLNNFSAIWLNEYNLIFKDLLYDLTNFLSSDSSFDYKSSEMPVFKQLVNTETNNKYSENSKTARTSFAIVLPQNTQIEIKNPKSFFKRNYGLDKLAFTEVALVKENKEAISFCIPLVSKFSKPSNYIALGIIEKIASKNMKVEYGVNQSFLLIKNPDKINFNVEVFDINTEKEMDSLLENIVESIRNSIDVNNLLFYSKDDFDAMSAIKDSFNLKQYKNFINDINIANKIICINQDSVSFENLKLYPSNIGIFNKEFSMKPNTIYFKNENEELKTYQKLYNLMFLNKGLNVSVNGYALEKEYTKISKRELKHLIENDIKLKSNYKLSRKTSLALLRSVSVYQKLVEFGVDKNRIRCNGLINKEGKRGVKFRMQEIF